VDIWGNQDLGRHWMGTLVITSIVCQFDERYQANQRFLFAGYQKGKHQMSDGCFQKLLVGGFKHEFYCP
jgi:hypothetical protein